MPRIWFQPPVKVETGKPGLSVVVSSVERAAKVLLDWPETAHGPKCQVAAVVLMRALKGEASPDEARAAFEKAARESGTLIEQ